MSVGLGLLRLPPSHFWAMTPREFDRAARALFGEPGETPGRAEMTRLMTMFPD